MALLCPSLTEADVQKWNWGSVIFPGMDVFAPLEKRELTLLCVSDTHEHFESVAKVMSQVGRLDIDYVIHSGDWTSLPVPEQDDPLKVAEAEANIASQLNILESIVKPVFYIPGNHDPKTLFPHLHPEPVSLSPYSRLLTLDPVPLAPGLSIVGFGGSPPGYKGSGQSFEGFPYDSQESYEEEFRSKVTFSNPDTQLIFVTHCGPMKIHTSATMRREGSAYSASTELLSFLLDPQHSVLLNIHGHMHPCGGLASIGEDGCTKVLNPGSLRYSNTYALVKLAKSAVTNKWTVSEVTLKTLQ